MTDDEKNAVYGIFDGLNFLFSLADYKAIECIVNNDLYESLLSICSLDSTESALLESSEISNEFYQL